MSRIRDAPDARHGCAPVNRSLEALLADAPALCDQPWRLFRVEDGEKGPVVWEVKDAPLSLIERHDRLPGPRRPLIVARNSRNPERVVKYFVTNDRDSLIETLLLVAFSR